MDQDKSRGFHGHPMEGGLLSHIPLKEPLLSGIPGQAKKYLPSPVIPMNIKSGMHGGLRMVQKL
jgi:hypothetical protein